MLQLAKKKFAIKTNQTKAGDKIAAVMSRADKMIKHVRQSVDRHLMDMHSTVKANVRRTIKYLRHQKDSADRESREALAEITNKLVGTPKPVTSTTKDSAKRRVILCQNGV